MNVSQERFAQLIGGTKRGIQENESGKTSPNSKLLAGLAQIGLNINWLLTGQGEMVAEDLRVKPVTVVHGRPSEEDYKIMAVVILRLQETIQEKELDVPFEKLVELAGLLFDHVVEAGKLDPTRVERFLRLVV